MSHTNTAIVHSHTNTHLDCMRSGGSSAAPARCSDRHRRRRAPSTAVGTSAARDIPLGPLPRAGLVIGAGVAATVEVRVEVDRKEEKTEMTYGQKTALLT
jgi:hypothetical protein